jgi:hypothetical protein
MAGGRDAGHGEGAASPRCKSQLWWVLTSIVALIAIASGMPIDRGICRQLKGLVRFAFC